MARKAPPQPVPRPKPARPKPPAPLPTPLAPLPPPTADDPVVLQIVLARLEDARALVAAVKAQRWDVVKWVVTANLALTAAEIAVARSEHVFVLLAALMAAFGVAAIWHYGRRSAAALRTANETAAFLAARYPQLPSDRATCRSKEEAAHDFEELLLFHLAIIASLLLPLFVALA